MSRPDNQDEADRLNEDAFISCIMAGADLGSSIVCPSDCYLPINQRVFAAIADMHDAGSPVSPTAVTSVLTGLGLTQALGGADVVRRMLQDGRAQRMSIGFFASEVAKASRRRRLKLLLAESHDLLLNGESQDKVLARIESELTALSDELRPDDFVSTADAMQLAIDEIMHAEPVSMSVCRAVYARWTTRLGDFKRAR
jgi:replicative DNA helicase